MDEVRGRQGRRCLSQRFLAHHRKLPSARHFVFICDLHEIGHIPRRRGNSGQHRRRGASGSWNTAEVVMREVDRQLMRVVLYLACKGIREPRHPAIEMRMFRFCRSMYDVLTCSSLLRPEASSFIDNRRAASISSSRFSLAMRWIVTRGSLVQLRKSSTDERRRDGDSSKNVNRVFG